MPQRGSGSPSPGHRPGDGGRRWWIVGPTGQRFALKNGWPVGPIRKSRFLVPLGDAQGWENGWAFGPTIAAENRTKNVYSINDFCRETTQFAAQLPATLPDASRFLCGLSADWYRAKRSATAQPLRSCRPCSRRQFASSQCNEVRVRHRQRSPVRKTNHERLKRPLVQSVTNPCTFITRLPIPVAKAIPAFMIQIHGAWTRSSTHWRIRSASGTPFECASSLIASASLRGRRTFTTVSRSKTVSAGTSSNSVSKSVRS